MASRTFSSRRQVSGRLDLGVLRNVLSAMAGRTLSQPGVIHSRWRPGQEIAVLVAGVTGSGHWNVCGRLGQRTLRCICATMAAGTSVAGRRRVVHL